MAKLNVDRCLKRASKCLATAPVEAVVAYCQVLLSYPNNRRAIEGLKSLTAAQLASVLGRIRDLGRAGYWTEALPVAETLARGHPAHPRVACAVAECLLALDRPAEVAPRLAAAAQVGDDAEVLRALGVAQAKCGRFAPAREALEASVLLAPNNADAWTVLGAVRETLGDAPCAEAAFRSAIALPNARATAWYDGSKYIDFGKERDLYDALHAFAAHADVPPDQREYLEFAMARAEEARGDIDAAFERLCRGNALHRAAFPCDLDGVEKVVEVLLSRIETLPRAEAAGPGPRPVLIVGMPRSGTTLVERMLSGHAAVQGEGELTALNEALLPHLVESEWSAATTAAIADSYCSVLNQLSNGAPVIVDKLPANALRAGYALAAMPDARVIHMRRHPVATCFSSFKLRYEVGNEFAYDLGDLSRMHGLTERAMRRWSELFPDRVLSVDYEMLTERPEAEMRRILEFLRLDWDPACLEFHMRRGVVRTASVLQVRKQIYMGSSEAWRPYAAHLSPLIDALAEDVAAHERRLSDARRVARIEAA